MLLIFYNYLSREKESFKPIKRGRVGLYTCGPTVYNYAHIGNLRTYIFEDILRRTLEYSGYKVRHVMNLTDVDDKTIRDSNNARMSLAAFTEKYANFFFDDIRKLNILPAWKYPKATAHIREMIALIDILMKKNIAYSAEDGVYFDISKLADYGKLSRVKGRSLKTGARISADEYAKHEARDFALWKFKKGDDPSWPAPFGEGRPGWHIECSAMSMKYLGETFDIHAGAVDLIFPHHENEIAQSEGATDKPFVKYFIEGEHLLVDGRKMAKSLGNFLTLRDIETKGFNPLAFRYLAITAHYRSKLNFTWESLKAASEALEHLYDFVRELKSTPQKTKKTIRSNAIGSFKSKFDKSISDDLDTSRALGAVWELIRAYRKNPTAFAASEVTRALKYTDKILGLGLGSIRVEKIPDNIQKLVRERENYRKNKDWDRADKLRKQIADLGWEVKDKGKVTELVRKL